MKMNQTIPSVKEFYDGKTIFLTGGTGFIGQAIVEKILRTCNGIEKLYILMRPKKGQNINKRFEEMFNQPNMHLMKDQNPRYMEKVAALNGDLQYPKCGLSEEDIQILKNEVDIIIHCAASVNFNQSIILATHVNLRATQDLMNISREMKKLKVFMYVSTAYSHAPRHQVKEKFYSTPIQANQLIELVKLLDEKTLEEITPAIRGEWPNNYAFTKAVAENLIAEESRGLPTVVIRPSIVIASAKEPFPGWINSMYGPSGIFLAGSVGILRCMKLDTAKKLDMIPVDYLVNSILASISDRANQSKESGHGSLHIQDAVPIYNYCSSSVAPFTVGQVFDIALKLGRGKYSPVISVWYPSMFAQKNHYIYVISFFLLQTIPSYLADGVLHVMGRKMQAVRMMQRLKKLLHVISWFWLCDWDFGIDNTLSLWQRLSAEDKKLFEFNMVDFNWSEYYDSYLKGIRVYIMKDPLETLPEGRKKMRKLYIIHVSFSIVLLLLLGRVVYFFVNLII